MASWRREGDLVVASPRWAEPHARRAFGDALMPLRDVARPDEAGYLRAIEAAAPGERGGAPAGWRLVEERGEGRLTLRLWENPAPERFAFDVVDAVEAGLAEVSWQSAGGESLACPFGAAPPFDPFGHPPLSARRYVCGPEPWHSVSVTIIDDASHRPRRCVYAPPPPAPWAAVTVRVRGLPATSLVVGHWGQPYLYDREGDEGDRVPATLALRARGEEVGAIERRDGDGWASFRIPLRSPPGDDGLSFRVSGEAAEGRPLCWEARLR
ncbi:MAG TPA: hypothetical protein VFS00_16675 [Polyangiaceae bacterium]|nr:hypothetical protein [Polyangiaceae bacterium]